MQKMSVLGSCWTDRVPAKRTSIDHAFTSELAREGHLSLALETRKGLALGVRVRAHILAVISAAAAIGVELDVPAQAIENRLGGS